MGVKIDDDFTGDPDKDGSHPRSTSKSKRKSGKKKPSAAHPPSAASQLVELALERYRFGVSEDGEPYAVRPGRHVVRLLRGGKNSLRAELSNAFHQKHRKVPPQQALADALLVLEGTAQDQDPGPVHVRVAHADGAVWLDLGDAAETVIKIDPTGWVAVGSEVPVLFRRTALTGILPKPDEEGGAIGLLWKHLNVSPPDQPLVLAWLVAAIIDPESPHPILSMFGEQGTGKSTASKRVVALVDPSPAPLRKPPRDSESWVT